MCLQGICTRKLLVYLVGSVCRCVATDLEFRLHTCSYIYMMMSWLCKEPMTEHVAVEFWSRSAHPGMFLQMLPLQFLKSLDWYKLILSQFGEL